MSYSFKAMNTTFNVYQLETPFSKKVESWCYLVEETLSRFLSTSELSQLNSLNGRLFLPSKMLYEAVKAAYYYYNETNGIFNPFLYHPIQTLGYDQSFEQLPTDQLPQKVAAFDAVNPIMIHKGMRSIQLASNVGLDLGGIAKGWSIQQMANQLKKKGTSLGAIDGGGDIVTWGPASKHWSISLSHPFDASKNLTTIKVKSNSGIATSSVGKRSWKVNGHTHHHIIDGRNSKPSSSELLQVTVVSEDLTVSEVYAKCILILGWDAGLKLAKRHHPSLEVIAVTKEGNVLIEKHVKGQVYHYGYSPRAI
ncbi:ApbE family lipoprotein [Priestia megaterium WSH-002]|uniref:FAD:protein FMN transferase n=1 Tax=Priestia megaterium (strain WSH-002) TaxID=1006007 RepID=A0A8D4BLV2_PRIMW|nr:FAD:protein FMN transferase [Priestia megaterium]AEN91283.1 ApbE family lipoprotein [Priestia megaterium WSH-002]QDZ81960.1 FAD:protein FMN transferase [Priestia megaterium]